jgi:hypothetical protein
MNLQVTTQMNIITTYPIASNICYAISHKIIYSGYWRKCFPSKYYEKCDDPQE